MQTTFTKIEEYEKQIQKPEVTKAKSTYSSIFNTVLHKIKGLVSTTPISDKASESKITEFHDFKNKFKQIMQERKTPLELPVATQESISLRKG